MLDLMFTDLIVITIISIITAITSVITYGIRKDDILLLPALGILTLILSDAVSIYTVCDTFITDAAQRSTVSTCMVANLVTTALYVAAIIPLICKTRKEQHLYQ